MDVIFEPFRTARQRSIAQPIAAAYEHAVSDIGGARFFLIRDPDGHVLGFHKPTP